MSIVTQIFYAYYNIWAGKDRIGGLVISPSFLFMGRRHLQLKIEPTHRDQVWSFMEFLEEIFLSEQRVSITYIKGNIFFWVNNLLGKVNKC